MFKNNGGFTLVELIVVIAILAILAGVAVPAYSAYINNANDAAVIAELDAISTAVQAANATKGEISKVEVRTVAAAGSTPAYTTIKVIPKSGETLADKFGDNFESFYKGEAGAPADADKSVTISVANTVILKGNYTNGANWENGKWTEVE